MIRIKLKQLEEKQDAQLKRLKDSLNSKLIFKQ